MPADAPNLARLDMLVELHNLADTPKYQALIDRFRGSHRLEIIGPGRRDPGDFQELHGLQQLDQLLAFWEWRRGPTPWLFMTGPGPRD